MQLTAPSTEAEMVLQFLKMELTSPRFSQNLKNILATTQTDKKIITHGNLASPQENHTRAEILSIFRGYNRNAEIFENFPPAICWHWAIFNKNDLQKIIYIEYSYWNEISNYTGSPIEAASTIRSGKIIFDVPNDRFLAAAQQLREGNRFPPLIFLTCPNQARFIILEGHLRMTAYALELDYFVDIPVLLGQCSSQALNAWYGKMPKRQ